METYYQETNIVYRDCLHEKVESSRLKDVEYANNWYDTFYIDYCASCGKILLITLSDGTQLVPKAIGN